MALSKRNAAEMSARVYGLLTEGKTDLEIMDDLGLETADYNAVKIMMFDLKAEEMRQKPREHTFIEYMVEQQSNINMLKEMVKEFRQADNHNAVVGAMRLRSDILDKIITRGQEMGLIEKEPDKSQVVMGMAVAQLSNQELKASITSVVSEVNQLVSAYGDKGFMDLEPGDTHHGEKLEDKQEEEK